ncbi:MAG: efflux transporter outer membrane subunit [Rhodanobacter sp.]
MITDLRLRTRPLARHPARAFIFLVSLALAGCAVGPDYHRPDAPAVARYTAQPLPAATATAHSVDSDSDSDDDGDAQRFLQGRDVPARWWTTFGNDELNRRVSTALRHSPTIASAQAALRQAQEQARAAGAVSFPSVDASAGVTRQKQSGAAFGGAFTFAPLTVYNASISVGYGIDLFGGTRRGIEAQAALTDVQRAQTDATYLTLAANVVTASLQEASLREQLRATDDILGSQRKSLQIAEQQQQFGATSLSDTLAVRTQLAATQATLPPLRARLASTRNQLATYLGTTPAQLELAPLQLEAITLPRDIPVSLPSKLVEQRPDIRAASARLHAATAQVGVATAAMLPQISLSGSGGSQALHAGELFSAGTRAWSLGLGLTQPLFHGGELRHKKRAAQAGLEMALADWQQTVLVAFQNVADALQALQFDAQGLAAQAASEAAASQQLALTRQQYQLGATGYLELLNAERSNQQARIALIQARTARLADTAALYAALGGGWQDTSAPSPIKQNR